MASTVSKSNLNENVCIICRIAITNSDGDVAEVRRGLDKLIEFSDKHNDAELNEYLTRRPKVVKVHNRCRLNYTSKRRFEQKSHDHDSPVQVKTLRSNLQCFDWKMHCFLCSEPCSGDQGTRRVETLEMKDNLLQQCTVRSDAWGLEIQGRLSNCCDLVAEEALYHKNCHRNFFRISVHEVSGRPSDGAKNDTFEKVCDWLELNDSELLTLEDVVNKAKSLQDCGHEVYTEKRYKQKLQDRYGVHIQFNEIRGRRNVICWREMASYIINEKWKQQQLEENKAEHIVTTAAKLLRATILEAEYDTTMYPTATDIQESQRAKDWMPNLLQLFLDCLICPEEKKTALGHCIVQSVRPRSVIAPIPFAVGVSVDHICASKFLLNLLHKLGMSVSYDEVHRFKQSVAQSEADDQPEAFPPSFTQFAADNVDHDVCTLDGSGTLHAMGVISVTNRNGAVNETNTTHTMDVPVKRCKVLQSVNVANMHKVPLLHCTLAQDCMAGISFRPQFHASVPCSLPPSVNLDTLWHVGWFVKDSEDNRPSWAGFNSSVVRGRPVLPSDIRLRPIIDCNPNDPSCVYSTLVYITKEAEKLQLKTPVVTFDQPLWLKAIKIVNSRGLNVVCRLGAFHVQMNFLGSLGTLMAGSGLEEVLQCCYGPNTVKHIMSGKAVARAVRANFLVESALTILLLKSVMSSGIVETDCSCLKMFYSLIVSNGFDANTEFPPSLSCIEQALNDVKRELAQKSRTAKLWLLYLDYVATLKLFLRAERTADWQLHLLSIRQMIHLFAATGHSNYAKCARLYVEMMTDLPDTHPEIYEEFMSGAHIARRSSKSWGGLSVDLTIEQAMMRAVKGHGGLTHGRGVSDSVRGTWIASVHKTAAVKTALAQLVDIEYCHELVQHPELGKARGKRDTADLNKLIEFLESYNPFDAPSSLHSITSGVAATESDNVNCDEAEDVGARIVQSMNGVNFAEVSLKRKHQIRTLADVSCTASGSRKKPISQVDTTVLFNRLLVIMQRSPDMEKYFSYELSAQPTSLFKDKCMRKADKAQLAKEIRKDITVSDDPHCTKCVVDGGYLLRAVTWTSGASYGAVAQQYVAYVDKHFGRSSVIVFDGYCNGPSTKDHEHQRRAKRYVPDIVVASLKTAYHDQSGFLSNDSNKCGFVSLLVESLTEAGYTVQQATDDADTLVVKVALDFSATGHAVRVLANDTDILIMLVSHYQPHMCDLLFGTGFGRGQSVASVAAIANSLGSCASQLLVIHAISGCDTTSSLFGHGKVSVFKKLRRSPAIKPCIDVIESPVSSHAEVVDAGCTILSFLYGGSRTDKLNKLRYNMYMHATAANGQLPRPERMPPTENAARFHLYRVHLQTVQWKLLSTSVLNPLDWGWKLHNGKYIPVATDIDIAPADILKVACCKCSADSKRPCGTRACLCVKNGLGCISACKNCAGVSCENVTDVIAEDDIADEVEMLNPHEQDLVDEDSMEYYMPWTVEEEVALSN